MNNAVRSLPSLAWFVLGAIGAGVGLLPWLVSGGKLPIQNLATDQSTAVTPFALLPFSQYYLTSIVALLVVGPALAGVAARALAHRRSRFATTFLTAGVLTVQGLAVVQSSVVTVGLLEESTRTLVYAGSVVAVTIVSILMGILILLLIARAPVPGAAIALSLAAVVSANWVGTALRDVTLFGPVVLMEAALFLLRWTPAVLVGCLIAWCGFRTTGRIVAVVVSLAALWIGPAFFTAVSSAAGTRVLAPYPSEMAEYGIQVFTMALTSPGPVIPPLIAASVIGIAGRLVLARAPALKTGSTRRGASRRRPQAGPRNQTRHP